jgi:hypothetical protein
MVRLLARVIGVGIGEVLVLLLKRRDAVRSIRCSSRTAVASSRAQLPRSFREHLRVLPDTQTVALVNGNSPNEEFWSEETARRKDATSITLRSNGTMKSR